MVDAPGMLPRSLGRDLLAGAALLVCLPGCSLGLFDGPPIPDQSRPVARIETTGGEEFGVATEFGILFLGRTASEGVCRVTHYYAEDQVVDDGEVEPFGGVYRRAAIERRHQRAPLWTDELTGQEDLVAIYFDPEDLDDVVRTSVELAVLDGVSGNALRATSTQIPAGAGVFVRDEDKNLHLVGLVAAKAVLESGTTVQPLWIFHGLEQMREALLQAERESPLTRVKYRSDDLWLREPAERTTTDRVRITR